MVGAMHKGKRSEELGIPDQILLNLYKLLEMYYWLKQLVVTIMCDVSTKESVRVIRD